jgi:D-glycero-alpha-D-manno-heptose-7-phosphate kinase
VQLASDIEAKLIHAPTGIQDYWGAVRGAVNVIRFPPGRVDVTTKPPSSVRGLEDQLLLCYSGKSRASAINNWEIFKRVFDGDTALLATLNEIGAAAERCADAITDGNLSRAILVSSLEWQLRCKLWPKIESAETKRLDVAAKKAGALFTRVCGAGGGGVMSIFVEPDSRERVKAALVENGGVVLNAKVAERGVSVT